MNERQHIALTEAQIIAAEKGELQLETRDGRKVVQFIWLREPLKQTDNSVLTAVFSDGEARSCFIDGMFLNKQALNLTFSSQNQPNQSKYHKNRFTKWVR